MQGVDCWQEAARLRVVETRARVVDLHSVDMLHAVELTVQQLLLVVCVLELPEDGHVDEIQLLLNVEMTLLVVLGRRQALLDMPPQSLQVNVEVSLQWRQMLVNHGLDHSFLDLVQLLVGILVAQASHVAGDPVQLMEHVGKSVERLVNSAVKAVDVLEVGPLSREELLVLSQ